MDGVFDRTKDKYNRERSIVEHLIETLDVETTLDDLITRLSELRGYYNSKGYSNLFIEISYDDDDRARVRLKGWLPEDDKDYAARLATLDQFEQQNKQREEAEFERLRKKLGK